MENDLEAKWVVIVLYLNTGLWNGSLTTDDVSKKYGLGPLQAGPIYPQQA